MRILIFNWRDIENPSRGGAEILTHEIAKRWVLKGMEVVQFSSLFKGAAPEKNIDGVRVIRQGAADFSPFKLPVHIAAYYWYKKNSLDKKGKKFDLVIDEIHGLPFFTPLFVKEKKIALICEVAQEIWDVNFRFPINKIGRLIENNYFRFYQNTPFLTISSSTKKDLISKGLHEDMITILPMGLTLPKNIKRYPKEEIPTIVFVGRLTKAKGIEEAIRIIALLKRSCPLIKFWIIGRGERSYESKLIKITEELNLTLNIVFWGFVDETTKFELMSRAHILLTTSVKEGWGLTVSEAGIVGTPVVAYEAGGLSDIIQNGINGYLIPRNPNLVAKTLNSLLLNKDNYCKLQKGAETEAKKYNWDNTADKALQAIQKII
ncbi:MAG: glycosyltransferase family 4 protein [Candidatus Gottesmanbacteria bacterium]